jgi:hypothetical protein
MANVLKDASLSSVAVLSDGGWAASGGFVETNGPWALRFNSTKNTDMIFALWLPTSLGDQNGANTQNYSITVPAGYTHATLITMKDKVKWGEISNISSQIQSGNLTVSISEKPVFVVLGENEYIPPVVSDFIDPINFNTWTLTPNSGNPEMLFDERRTNIEKNPIPNMQNSWDPGGLHRYAAVDLGAEYNLSNIYVWDRDGALAAGKVLAVYAYTGGGQPSLPVNSMTGVQVQTMLAGSDWVRVAWYDFASWEAWVEAIVNVKTRYLVLGFEDGPSTFYGNPWPVDWLPVPEMVLKGALASPAANAAPTIISANSTSVVSGRGGTFQVRVTGNPTAFTFSLSGAVPTGVSINNTSGLITILGTTALGNHTFTITVSNGVNPDATMNFTLAMNPFSGGNQSASIPTLNPAMLVLLALMALALGGTAFWRRRKA